MASSQVGIPPSSSFGCVLRDRNGCRTRDSNASKKNFNELVQNQLSSCRSTGSDSLANENSHPRNDFADLWVHQPQTSKENNDHSTEPGHSRIPDRSNSNEDANNHNNHIDLWVHNPHRNNDENNQKKSNSREKCDRARDSTVLSVESKRENGVSSGPHAIPPRGRSEDGAHSLPVSRVRSPESSRPVSSSQRRRSLEGGASTEGNSQHGTVSICQAESSVKVPNLGAVSSLVQKWRNFEGKSSSKCNSVLVSADNVESLVSSGSCDESADIRPGTPSISEGSNADCESVRTVSIASPGRDSNASEKDRIRVADIIRKLSSNSEENNDREHSVCHESLPRVRTSVDQPEQRPFSPVSCSPRIRGRQAFCDFQMQMERERHKELEVLARFKAVSKFSHRGRIQATLKVRFLHRGAEVKDGRPQNCTSSNSNGLKRSAIMQLRKIFSLGAKHSVSDLRSPEGEAVDCSTKIEKFSGSCQQSIKSPETKRSESKNPPAIESDAGAEAEGSFRSKSGERDSNHESNNMLGQSGVLEKSSERKENHHQELPKQTNPSTTVTKGSADTASAFRLMPVQRDIKHPQSNSLVQSLENLYEENSSRSDGKPQWSSSGSCNCRKQEFSVTGTSFQGVEGNFYLELQDTNNQQTERIGNESTNETSEAQGDWEEEKDCSHHLACSWVSDVFDQMSGLEDLQCDYQQEVEINNDWIHDVSRPRSTWEDLRQARYQEMLDPFVENKDIRCLLERKSVSSFLSSGMRENIDRLMMSRLQEISRTDQLEKESQQERTKDEKCEVGEEDYEENNEEEEDSIDYSDDDYEDQEHEIQSGKHNMPKSYINQTTSWVRIMGDNYSDQTASPYIEQSPLSNISTIESQRSMNHHSIEMELICQLKGNIEQLHQEISELRRSIKSCVNMQMELQQSTKQDIAAALCQSGKQKRRERRDSRRGRCHICCGLPIDSLLYRCGHMCTCFNCARELQCSSGKCPVCQAPITDVVRAYVH